MFSHNFKYFYKLIKVKEYISLCSFAKKNNKYLKKLSIKKYTVYKFRLFNSQLMKKKMQDFYSKTKIFVLQIKAKAKVKAKAKAKAKTEIQSQGKN